MDNKYFTGLMNNTKGDGKLEKLDSLAVTSAIIVFFNYQAVQEMLHRYFT